MARWRSGRSSDRRWAASTAGTTAAASSSNAATVKPVRWPNTAGRFRRLSRCAIMGRHHRGKSRPDILRTTRYRECGLMAKEPARRYPTTGELADDLRRFLRDEPIRARPVSLRERLWRKCRRSPALAGLTATVLLLLGALAGLTAWSLRTGR